MRPSHSRLCQHQPSNVSRPICCFFWYPNHSKYWSLWKSSLASFGETSSSLLFETLHTQYSFLYSLLCISCFTYLESPSPSSLLVSNLVQYQTAVALLGCTKPFGLWSHGRWARSLLLWLCYALHSSSWHSWEFSWESELWHRSCGKCPWTSASSGSQRKVAGSCQNPQRCSQTS